MSESTFTFTPGTSTDHPALRDLAKYRDWQAPAGHAQTCRLQVPPPMRTGRGLGDTAMAAYQCSCSRNALARSLRKLSGAAPARKRKARPSEAADLRARIAALEAELAVVPAEVRRYFAEVAERAA